MWNSRKFSNRIVSISFTWKFVDSPRIPLQRVCAWTSIDRRAHPHPSSKRIIISNCRILLINIEIDLHFPNRTRRQDTITCLKLGNAKIIHSLLRSINLIVHWIVVTLSNVRLFFSLTSLFVDEYWRLNFERNKCSKNLI